MFQTYKNIQELKNTVNNFTNFQKIVVVKRSLEKFQDIDFAFLFLNLKKPTKFTFRGCLYDF